MASIDDESGSSSKKTVGKRGVTRLQKIHKAKSNGKRIEVKQLEFYDTVYSLGNFPFTELCMSDGYIHDYLL